MKKRILIILILIFSFGIGGYLIWGPDDTEYAYRTEAITRGEVEKVVRATGTLNPLQTVAASLSAPQLYAIANDLSRMQVEASVDEADIGQIVAGQEATFTVDAYPDENFEGTVAQVRLSPITVQNVVTYTVIIEVPNPDQKLRPGMTATASIMIDRRDDVLRVPEVALRFQPPAAVLEAYNERLAADSGANTGMQAGGEGTGERRRDGVQAGQSQDGPRRERSGTRRAGAADSGRGGRRPNRSQDGASGNAQGSGDRQGTGGMRGMRRPNVAMVWVLGADEKLSRVRVRTGLSDQRYVELLDGKLQEGDKVILGAISEDRSASGPRTTNPLQPQMGGTGGGRRGP